MAKYTLKNDTLWQWDVGQLLIVPSAYITYETHFYSSEYPDGITVEAEDYTTVSSVTYVEIPNCMLAYDVPITVYSYSEGTDVAHTETATVFKVLGRPKPSDYVYTEEEQKTWEALEERIEDAEEDIEELEEELDEKLDDAPADGKTYGRKNGAWSEVEGAESISWDNITNKPSTFTPSTHTHSDYATAIEALEEDSHTHSNKSVLDAITSAIVSGWDSAVTWISTNGTNLLNHLSNSVVHITASERTTWNGKQDSISDLATIRTGATRGNTLTDSYINDLIDAKIEDAIGGEY